MKRFAPLLTLLAVAVLGGALFVLNTTNDPARKTAATTSAAAAAPVSAPAAAGAGTTTVDLSTLGTPPTTVDLATVTPAGTAPGAAAAPAATPDKAYAGRSSGNEVTVAIAIKGGRAVGYICDGKKAEAWLEGTVTGKDISLKSADGRSTITGTIDDAQSFGTVAVNGKQWPYAAKAVVAPAGLYQGRADVRGVANRIGWIVLNDGTQTGVRQAAGGAPEPAPVLDPANPGAVVLDGVPVTVTTINGGDTVIQR